MIDWGYCSQVVSISCLCPSPSPNRNQECINQCNRSLHGDGCWARVSVLYLGIWDGSRDGPSQQTRKTTAKPILGTTHNLRNAGYSVRCMLRNRADRPFSFLVETGRKDLCFVCPLAWRCSHTGSNDFPSIPKDWGATVVEGSLSRPETWIF